MNNIKIDPKKIEKWVKDNKSIYDFNFDSFYLEKEYIVLKGYVNWEPIIIKVSIEKYNDIF